jgi:dienelactone hydrolase
VKSPATALPVIANLAAPEPKGAPLPEWTKLRPVLSMPGMEEVQARRGLTYARAGGREYKLDLYIPDVASREPVPVVVLVHGLLHPALAPHVRELPAFSGQARWLAALGYAVAVPELGSPATGPAQEQWLTDVPALRQRVEATLAFLRKESTANRLDTSRMCLWAMSGGGLWGVTPALKKQPPAGLKCVAAWYPMLDAPGLPKGTGAREALGTVDAKKLPPLLVVRAGRGAPLTLVEVPEGHHAFDLVDDVEPSREAMRQTARFFEQYLTP